MIIMVTRPWPSASLSKIRMPHG